MMSYRVHSLLSPSDKTIDFMPKSGLVFQSGCKTTSVFNSHQSITNMQQQNSVI